MELLVPARCCGPSTSGNGGWVSGAVAGFLDHRPAEVSLRLPPPLDVPMDVAVDDGRVRVTLDGALVAEGGPGAFAHEPPPPVALDVAREAATRCPGLVAHEFPHCLTCGPERDIGDGLRVFPGPLTDDMTVMAAPVRGQDLPEAAAGTLPEPMVWAALDCPSGWPAIAAAASPMVLARMVAEVVAPEGVPTTELVAVGELRSSEGRKHTGTSALYLPDGTLLARAEALWIELRQP